MNTAFFILGGLIAALFGVELIGRAMRWGEPTSEPWKATQASHFPGPSDVKLRMIAQRGVHEARLRAGDCERATKYRWN